MDGYMGGGIYEGMGGWTNGHIDVCMYAGGRIYGRMNERANEWINEWVIETEIHQERNLIETGQQAV